MAFFGQASGLEGWETKSVIVIKGLFTLMTFIYYLLNTTWHFLSREYLKVKLTKVVVSEDRTLIQWASMGIVLVTFIGFRSFRIAGYLNFRAMQSFFEIT